MPKVVNVLEAPDISAVNAPTNGMLLRSKVHYSSISLAANRTRWALSESWEQQGYPRLSTKYSIYRKAAIKRTDDHK